MHPIQLSGVTLTIVLANFSIINAFDAPGVLFVAGFTPLGVVAQSCGSRVPAMMNGLSVRDSL